MIIEKYRNYLRKKRLFYDKKAMNRFISENFKNKIEGYILAVTIIKHYMNSGDDKEVKTRSKHLLADGLMPPENLRGCDNMIKDLKQWYF